MITVKNIQLIKIQVNKNKTNVYSIQDLLGDEETITPITRKISIKGANK